MIKPIKEFIKKVKITKNAPQKFISVVFAIILWLLIMDYENPDMVKTFYRVPVQYIGVERLELKKLYPETPLDEKIDVTVRGRRRDILSLAPKDVVASVDLNTVQSGTMDLPLSVVLNNETVSVQGYSKSALSMVFDKVVERSFPVTDFAEGEIKAPFSVLKTTLSPSEITLKGPSKKLAQVGKVFVPYELMDVKSSFVFYDKFVVIDYKGDIIEDLDVPELKVKVDVMVGKTVEVPLEVNYKIPKESNIKLIKDAVSTDKITILGEVDIVKNIKKIVAKELELPNEVGEHVLSVQPILPKGVTLISPSKISTKIVCDTLVKKTFTLSVQDIQWLNIGANLSAKALNSDFQITVELTGLSSDFERLEEEGLTLDIDVNGLEQGAYLKAFNIFIPEGFTATSPEVLTGNLNIELTSEE